MYNKIVIAPDSFKGTMTSAEICDLIGQTIQESFPGTEIVKIPVADGGEGMVEAYLANTGGRIIRKTVTGPKFQPVESFYGLLKDKKTAVIEMAAASGLPLAGDHKDPMHSTTFGIGELILDAMDRGCKKILLGIGGSATMDGGIGAAGALGMKFLGRDGNSVPLTAEGLGLIHNIDTSTMDKRLFKLEILIASDVQNYLCGPVGAAYVFGRQKGATDLEIEKIDHYLYQFCELIRKQSGRNLHELPGMGAAGGIALPFLAFLNARILSGIDIILDIANFDKKIDNADMVITGEGKLDGQSLGGKVPLGVAKRAKKQGIPVVAIVGDVGCDYDKVYEYGISAIFSTNKAAVPFENARLTCREDLRFLVRSLMCFKKI